MECEIKNAIMPVKEMTTDKCNLFVSFEFLLGAAAARFMRTCLFRAHIFHQSSAR